MTPEEILEAGNVVVAPVLRAAGFNLGPVSTGRGSGGAFASERWENGSRWVELGVRYALGIVRFGWGDDQYDYADVVGALGVDCSYPGFSDDPVEGFRHVAADLAGPLALVLGDDHEQVHALVAKWHKPGRVLP